MAALLAVALAGCAKKQRIAPGPDYMILDDVSFVKKFPRTVHLDNPERVGLDVPGILDIAVKGSLLIFSTQKGDGMWEFFSLPTLDSLGGYLRQGNGPNELIQTPWLYSTSFLEKGGELMAYLYDFARGRLLEMNVSRTISERELNIATIEKPLPATLFGFIVLGDNTFFCKEITTTRDQQIRYLLKDGARSIPDNFRELNWAYIISGEDHNILGTLTGYNYSKGRIVEAPIMLNYINIYSVEGSFGKTVCTDEKLDNISEIQMLDIEERRGTYGSLRIYDNSFGVIRFGETQVIQFFDMNGKPLAELFPAHRLTSFDIDSENGHLYTHDRETDEFFRYDIKNIVGEITKP